MENYENIVGWCPFCNQGWIGIRKDIETHQLFLICDECYLEYDNPTKMIEDEPRHEPCRYDWLVPTMDEIKEMKWDTYIITVERGPFFAQLNRIKDRLVQTSLESLEGNKDLAWSSYGEEYQKLQHLLTNKKEKEAYEKIVNELLLKAIRSILMTIDGEDDLAELYTVDLVVEQNNKSLKKDGALHKGFDDFLLEREEDAQLEREQWKNQGMFYFELLEEFIETHGLKNIE